ncbi:MAG TPA: C45 family peptidase [Vicinamibacteria bacterium]|nr:C45 family peptidase [Vicinamibacteria bacterium]
MSTSRRSAMLLLAAVLAAGTAHAAGAAEDPRLKGAARGGRSGWITVRLQGTPGEIGYQHGKLLAPEIADLLAVTKLSLTHDGKHDWAFYRKAAETVFWPLVNDEYRQEMQGIAAGAAAGGATVDLWDVVALNASIEVGYYTAVLDHAERSAAPDKCSAFVATGRFTRDGQPVIAHNNWSGYLEGSRWNVIFDLRPASGHRILMDGMPGLIHSGDDFGISSAGLAITETTITAFKGFDPSGVPEFVRARKAMQYAASIDDFDRIMRTGNNGGYANAWLVADVNTGEIARLELGLRNVTLERTKDGYFAGANFPVSAKLAAEETKFRLDDPSLSPNARKARADEILKANEGRIDLAFAKGYLSDHYDAYEKRENAPSERSLCGHVDLSPRGMGDWFGAWGPAGTVQSKVADAAMAKRMALEAAMGHPCGTDYRAATHLAQHADYAWAKPLMRDLVASPWTLFEAK